MSDLYFSCVDINNREVRVLNPGQKFSFHVKARQKIDKYQIRVLDQKNNIRFNSYGKALDKISLNWLVPKNIKKSHYGIWQIQLKLTSNTFYFLIIVKQDNFRGIVYH
ncbi:MAG: hypothetical protein ACXACU_01800 [Candidatus Hodarchaeales archaeon]|jgi:hypothetical protein